MLIEILARMKQQILKDFIEIMEEVYGIDISNKDIDDISSCEGTEYQIIIDQYYYTFYITEKRTA